MTMSGDGWVCHGGACRDEEIEAHLEGAPDRVEENQVESGTRAAAKLATLARIEQLRASVGALSSAGLVLTPLQLLLIEDILLHATPERGAFVKVGTLAARSGASGRGVQKALEALELAGVAEARRRQRRNGSQTSNHWTLLGLARLLAHVERAGEEGLADVVARLRAEERHRFRVRRTGDRVVEPVNSVHPQNATEHVGVRALDHSSTSAFQVRDAREGAA